MMEAERNLECMDFIDQFKKLMKDLWKKLSGSVGALKIA